MGELVEGKTCGDMLEDEPIYVISRTSDTVTFVVNNTWDLSGDGEMDTILTQYTDTSGAVTCDSESTLPQYEVLTYTAECDENGLVLVEVLVSDDSFDSTEDIAELPDQCSPFDGPDGKKCRYQRTFACGCETKVPSMVPTNAPALPTTKPSAAPSGPTTSIPSLVPSSSPTSCYDREDGTLTLLEGENCSTDSDSEPVYVVSRTDSTVTFVINQT